MMRRSGKMMRMMSLQMFNDEISHIMKEVDERLQGQANVEYFAEDFKFPLEDPLNSLMLMHSAWYGGDTNIMHETYKELVDNVGGSTRNSFWTKPQQDGITKMHIPIASDIAQTSADMLFSEMPEVSIPEAEEGDAKAQVTQERLDEILECCEFGSRLLEGAESCAAMGGVYLVPTWNTMLCDHPILVINQADSAIPEFQWGFLTAVTFYKEVCKKDYDEVWRHMERHEAGKIINLLYKGTRSQLGSRQPLSMLPQTAGLQEEIPTGYERLMLRYIPNMKPNRRFRGAAQGQSDFAGIEPLMDSLDEVYSSWMRDVRLARARIIVPSEFLQFDDRGDGRKDPYFDTDQSIYTALEMDPLSVKDGGLTMQQFDIRAQEHRDTAYELLERIVTHAGYSPQTFGLSIEGASQTGTALNIRERKTYITKNKKWRYWKNALEDILEMMLFIDKEILGNREIEVLRPSLKLTDSMNQDISSLSTALQSLNNAMAVSIDTKVRWLHPDWSDEQVEAEVERIKEETGVGQAPEVPNPLAPDVEEVEELDEFGNPIPADNLDDSFGEEEDEEEIGQA